jgi:rubrerythrin
MDKAFSPEEILRIAVKIEAKGKALYGDLEKKAASKDVKEVWKYLKEQEEEHRKTFQDMLDNIGDYFTDEFSPGEYDAYMKAIASEYVFTQDMVEKKAGKPFACDLAAVNFAIGIEKDSILTYSALKAIVLSDRQNVLDRIINEEKKHLVELSGLKVKLK